MTREEITGAARIITEIAEECGGVELSRYLANYIAREVISFLRRPL
jgi:hypothetical protein